MDAVVNVRQRSGVYQALERLLRLGLIEVNETVQESSRPDRVVYAITDRGREVAVAMLPRLLSNISADFPKFPAAFSLLSVLPADDARRQFELRAEAVRNELIRLDTKKLEAPESTRLSLLNVEYQTALLKSELNWIQDVIADITSGSIVWGPQVRNEVQIVEDEGM
jgi:DNA-binding PadR family transcriptional regulator